MNYTEQFRVSIFIEKKKGNAKFIARFFLSKKGMEKIDFFKSKSNPGHSTFLYIHKYTH